MTRHALAREVAWLRAQPRAVRLAYLAALTWFLDFRAADFQALQRAGE